MSKQHAIATGVNSVCKNHECTKLILTENSQQADKLLQSSKPPELESWLRTSTAAPYKNHRNMIVCLFVEQKYTSIELAAQEYSLA